jgi:hypothetical protein
MEIAMRGCGKMDLSMGKEVISGVMEIIIKGVFGLIRERGRQLFIIVQEGDMKVIGKMIKNMGREFFSIMKGQLKFLIIDYIFILIFVDESNGICSVENQL